MKNIFSRDRSEIKDLLTQFEVPDEPTAFANLEQRASERQAQLSRNTSAFGAKKFKTSHDAPEVNENDFHIPGLNAEEQNIRGSFASINRGLRESSRTNPEDVARREIFSDLAEITTEIERAGQWGSDIPENLTQRLAACLPEFTSQMMDYGNGSKHTSNAALLTKELAQAYRTKKEESKKLRKYAGVTDRGRLSVDKLSATAGGNNMGLGAWADQVDNDAQRVAMHKNAEVRMASRRKPVKPLASRALAEDSFESRLRDGSMYGSTDEFLDNLLSEF